MKLKYEAIIFDLDGVLLDTVEMKTQVFASMFEKYGPEVVQKINEYNKKYGGKSRSEKFRHYYTHILHKTLTNDILDGLCLEYSARTLKPSIDASCITGACAFLERQYKENNFYVVSAVEQKDLNLIIKKRKMSKYFKGIFGSPINKVTNIINIISANYYNSSKVLYIGDLLSDWETSKVVGADFVGVAKTPTFPSNVKVIKDFINGVPDAI